MNTDKLCPRKRKHTKGNPMRHYDLELTVMVEITKRTGYVWSLHEIAYVCGVTPSAIQYVCNSGLHRLWRLLHQDREFIRDLNVASGQNPDNQYYLP